MPQHPKITASRIGDFMEYLEHSNQHDLRAAGKDLFWLLPLIDQFLVKHDRTNMARELRKAFDKLEGDL